MVGPEGADRPRAGIILAGAALLLWPSILNWHPYLFWDTYGYFLQGKAYVRLMLAAAGIGPPPAEVAQGWTGAAGRMLARDPAIRSPTWSLVTYGTAVAGIPPLTVVAWVGDNILDFPGLSQAARNDPRALELFGKKYFVLPNPMYGSWQQNRDQ